MDSLAFVPVNMLPPELLARIFRFAHYSEHCLALHEDVPLVRGGPYTWLKYPNQPDTLSHVCSKWRRIALATSFLWSHIDIVIDDNRNRHLFTRAKVYAQRAGRHALEIHLCDPGSERERQKWRDHMIHATPSQYDDLHEFEFLDATTAPISSLVLDVFAYSHFRRAHFEALGYFLSKCEMGRLAHYIARVGDFTRPLFVETSETLQEIRYNTLQPPSSHLEEIWGSVKVLNVNGLCPHWSSTLYHGLVDLRLGSNVPEITEYQVCEILKASPGLRTLQLKSPITLEVPEGTKVTPFQLNDLEVLNIEDLESGIFDGGFDNGEIVRWIQPGAKPLRFTFFGMPTRTVAKFFKRSNVTRFYSRGWEPFTLVELLRLAPQLQTVVLNAFDLEVDTIGCLVDPIDEHGTFAPLTAIRIETLYLLGFNRLKLDDIQEAVDRYSVQRLFLWACDLEGPSSTSVISYKDPTTIRQKLSEIRNCPVVEYLTNNTDPVDPEDWE